MTIALGILLAVLAGGFVAWPLLQATSNEDDPVAPSVSLERQQRLEHDKQEAFGAIRDAEMDHHVGKLSDLDFELVRGKYEAEALTAIAALEQLKPPPPSANDKSGFRFCPGCGAAVPEKAKFCPACGRALTGKERVSKAARAAA